MQATMGVTGKAEKGSKRGGRGHRSFRGNNKDLKAAVEGNRASSAVSVRRDIVRKRNGES